MEDVATSLKEFIENEMRSCSMDYVCITPNMFKGHGAAESL